MIISKFLLIQAYICPTSVPNSAATTTDKYNFSLFTKTMTYGVIGGPVTQSLFYLYALVLGTSFADVRKVDASGSQI